MTDEHPVLVPSKTPFGVLEQCAACGAYMTPTDTYGVVPGSTDAAGRLGLLVVPVCMKCVCRFHTLPRSDRTGRLHDWCEEQARRGCLADIGAAAAREHDRLKCDAIEHAAEEDLVKWDASGPTQEEWDRAKARDLEGPDLEAADVIERAERAHKRQKELKAKAPPADAYELMSGENVWVQVHPETNREDAAKTLRELADQITSTKEGE